MGQDFSISRKEAEEVLAKNIKRDVASVIPAEVTSGAKDGSSGGNLSARPDQLSSEPLPQKFENPMVGNKANLSSDAQIIKDKAEEHLHNIHKSLRDIDMQVIKKKTRTKMSEKTPAQADKYDRCVDDLKSEGKPDDIAYAICQTSVLGNTGSDTKKSLEPKIEKAWGDFKKCSQSMVQAEPDTPKKKSKKAQPVFPGKKKEEEISSNFEKAFSSYMDREETQPSPYDEVDPKEVLIKHEIEPTQANINMFQSMLATVQGNAHPGEINENIIHELIEKIRQQQPQQVTVAPPALPVKKPESNPKITEAISVDLNKAWKPYKEWKAEQEAKKGGKKDDKEEKKDKKSDKPDKKKDKKKDIKSPKRKPHRVENAGPS